MGHSSSDGWARYRISGLLPTCAQLCPPDHHYCSVPTGVQLPIGQADMSVKIGHDHRINAVSSSLCFVQVLGSPQLLFLTHRTPLLFRQPRLSRPSLKHRRAIEFDATFWVTFGRCQQSLTSSQFSFLAIQQNSHFKNGWDMSRNATRR